MLVYLDDIIIMAAMFEDYLRLREVLTLLQNAGLMVKLEKCKYAKTNYLGVKITQDCIKTDTEKTEAKYMDVLS